MKNILVTGAKGQLGQCIQKITPRLKGFHFTFVDKDELDITHEKAVKSFLNNHKFHTLINCAAYTAVDNAETDAANAFKVNADAVGFLAKHCSSNNTQFIHISTDYVFNGDFNTPIQPKEHPQPINVYGASKLKGEELAMKYNPQSLIIRTAWVYSPYGKNFVKTMLHLFVNKKEISVVNDQKGTPTNAQDLAQAIINIIVEGTYQPGIYHFTNKGETTWFDFASAIKEFTQSQIKINPVPSAAYPTPAKRPRYSVLDLTKFKETFNQTIPEWKDSLKRLLKEL